MSVKHSVHDFKGGSIELNLTPIKAIKRFCLECMGGQQAEIDRCTAPLCPLYPFRGGDAHVYSDETKRRMAERAQNRDFGRKTTRGMGRKLP